MSDRARLESIFVEHLPTIDRVTRVLCRRYGFAPADADEVVSWIRLRFVESEYAVIGKFRGESSVPTYLSVIVASLFRAYRHEKWGRWRPSRAAIDMGDVAVRLERLVSRDGYTLRDAIEHLHAAGETVMSTAELTRLAARLPQRAPLRPVEVGAAALDSAESRATAEEHVASADHAHTRGEIGAALSAALTALPPEERVMVRMRYWDGASVADIARALGLAQKPLYRKLDQALAKLRRKLEATGVSPDLARDAIERQVF